MLRSSTAIATVGGCIAALLATANPVAAHPHVWVQSKSRVVYEKDTVTAIQQTWVFDEFYSAMAVQGLDTNNDGQYSREELDELAKINMEGLKEFAYFTAAKVGDAAIEFAPPSNAHLDYTGGILSLIFTLPLKSQAALEGFAFATYDTTFFIAFELAKEDGATLFGAPETCEIALRDEPVAPGSNPALGNPSQNDTLTGAFSEQFGGAAVASATKWAVVECKKS